VQPLLPTNKDQKKATCRSRSTKARRVLVMEKMPHNSDSFKPTQTEESAQTEGAGVCGMNSSTPQTESDHKIYSNGNGSGAETASCSNTSGTDESSSKGAAGYVMLDPFDIEIDRSIWPRVKEDSIVGLNYFEALCLGEELPPITVEEIDGRWTVIDGVHRLHAHRRMKESNFRADYKILCKVENFSSSLARLIHSYNINRKQGKPLEIGDYEKVAQAIYRENLGAPITDLAAKLNMDWKTFKKYVQHLKDDFEREREQTARYLKEMGFSDKSIERQLLEKYPYSKGSKRSSVNRRSVKARKTAAEGVTLNTSAGTESRAGESKPSSPFWASMGIDFSREDEASRREELHVIPGAKVLMERRIDFLRDELRTKYVRIIVKVTETMRKKELLLRANENLAGSQLHRGPPKRKKVLLDLHQFASRDGPGRAMAQASCLP